jgi:hypothetical protein
MATTHMAFRPTVVGSATSTQTRAPARSPDDTNSNACSLSQERGSGLVRTAQPKEHHHCGDPWVLPMAPRSGERRGLPSPQDDVGAVAWSVRDALHPVGFSLIDRRSGEPATFANVQVAGVPEQDALDIAPLLNRRAIKDGAASGLVSD